MSPLSESADTFGLLGVLMYAVTNRFSAEALEQIRMTAPKHAAVPMSLAANARTNLDFVSVTFVFIIVSFRFDFVGLFVCHRGNA